MPATLFIVSTPIGNLEDITPRALRVLREVALIAAEDTRRTAKLLSHFDIRTPTTSFYEHNEHEKVPVLLARLDAGDSVALVSDAGTPGVSDPGYRLVNAAVEAGIRVEAVPGASAILVALVSSGLPTHAFTFAGFPPAKPVARDRWLGVYAGRSETLVFFEAPHRVRPTLEAALRVLGDRPAAICRELTKLHETLVRGSISSLLSNLNDPRGEYTIVIGPMATQNATVPALPDESALLDEFCRLTEEEALGRREALARIAARYDVSQREVYGAIERAKKDRTN